MQPLILRSLPGLLFVLALTGRAAAQPNPVKPPLMTLDGHLQMVYTVAVSPDGKRIASASNSEIKVRDAATGKELFNHPSRGTNVFGLDFSPDGKLLAVGISKTIRLLDAATGAEKQTITCGPHFLFRLAFSPDGKRLAAAGGNNGTMPGDVHIWTVADGKEVLTLTGHTEPPLNVVYSGDGRHIVSCSGATSGVKAGEVRVWEADSGRLVHVLRGHSNNIYGVAVSPDGRRIVSGSGTRSTTGAAELKLWEAVSAHEVLTLAGHTGTVYSVVFSPDGRRIASGGSDGALKLWDTLTGKELFSTPAHTGGVYGVVYTPDGRRLITGGQDKAVKVWEVAPPGRDVPAEELTAERLDALWKDLADPDAGEAWRAVWTLAASPGQSVPHLGERVRVVPWLTDERKEQALRWVKDLDHRRFPVRDQASRELASLGEAAGPILRDALEGMPSAEVRRRIAELLDRIAQPALSPENVRGLRAVEVLEHVGTPEARQLLEKLAAGLPDAHLTREARASLDRLRNRP